MTRFPPLILLLVICSAAAVYAQSAPTVRLTASGNFSSGASSLDFMFEWGSANVGDATVLFDIVPHRARLYSKLVELWSESFTIPDDAGTLTYHRSFRMSAQPTTKVLDTKRTVTGMYIQKTWLVDAATGKNLSEVENGVITSSDLNTPLDTAGSKIVEIAIQPEWRNRPVRLMTMLDVTPDALNMDEPRFEIVAATDTKDSKQIK